MWRFVWDGRSTCILYLSFVFRSLLVKCHVVGYSPLASTIMYVTSPNFRDTLPSCPWLTVEICEVVVFHLNGPSYSHL